MDKALDEVRPYLIADGGNVEVAAVQDGVVMLRLQGACGTCPSSTATMKMGIERSLRVGVPCVPSVSYVPCVQLPRVAGIARLRLTPAASVAMAFDHQWKN